MNMKSISCAIALAMTTLPSFAQDNNSEKLNTYIECYNQRI